MFPEGIGILIDAGVCRSQATVETFGTRGSELFSEHFCRSCLASKTQKLTIRTSRTVMSLLTHFSLKYSHKQI